MLRSGVSRLDDFLRLLDREPGRRHDLQRCLTVAVSEFFRTPQQFDHLATHILPRLLSDRGRLRIWSAGCSYGPEPYSLVLLLQQMTPERPHYMLATDIDEGALAKARAADAFTERDLRNVALQWRGEHFMSGRPSKHALHPRLRSRVTFRRHDLLNEPPEVDFDLVVCRNVMMYFTAHAKRQLFENLHRALRPGGYLFVGDAEVLNGLPEAGFSRDAVGFYRKGMGVS